MIKQLFTILLLSLTIINAFICDPICQNNGLCYNVTDTQNTCQCDTEYTGFDCSLLTNNASFSQFNGSVGITLYSPKLTIEFPSKLVTGMYTLYVKLTTTTMNPPTNTSSTYIFYQILLFDYNTYVQQLNNSITMNIDVGSNVNAQLYVFKNNKWSLFGSTCSTIQFSYVFNNKLVTTGCNLGSGLFVVNSTEQSTTDLPNCSNNKTGDIIFLMTLVGLILVFAI